MTSGFDAHSYYKYDWTKFRAVLSSLGERIPGNLFYFTDSPNKGKQAAFAGLTVFIIRRPGNRVYKDEEMKMFKIVDSLEQFDFIPFED
jgi:methionine salvage enolase-phosphatase E1